MTPLESELAALRDRVARLEAEVRALQAGSVVREVAKTEMTPAVKSALLQFAEPPPLPEEPPVVHPRPVVAPSRLEATPSREIASTVWIAGVGAVIFLIGAVYGLTVSIQRGWIAPPVRVGGGLGIGLGLGYGAWRQFRRENRGLGVALLAAGIGTWMFAWYFGSHRGQLFPPVAGLLGTALAALVAGWIAARVRSDGALAVALATGLIAPLAFSTGRGSAPALMTYLLVLSGTQLALNYLARTGAHWSWSRVLGTVGVWLVAMLAAGDARLESPPLMFALLAALGASVLLLGWLPRHVEMPRWPGAVTVCSQLGLAVALWLVWTRSHFEREEFSVVLVILAVTTLALWPWARRRSPAGDHDLALLLLAVGFAYLAVAVALDRHWIVLAWGAFAALLAVGARAAQQSARIEAETLQVATVLAATAASMVWLVLAFEQRASDAIFLNRVFVGGALAATAWGVLYFTPGRLRILAGVAWQVVLVNAVAWELARALPAVQSENTSLAIGPVLATLTYAVVGVMLWLRGLNAGEEGARRFLRWTGYAWLAVASVKLLVNDLAQTDLLFRAVAALGMGAILIAAAWWANRSRE